MEKPPVYPPRETAERLKSTLKEALDDIMLDQKQARKAPRVYVIENSIDAAQLQRLSALNFEVMLSREKKSGILLLRTGSLHSTASDYEYPGILESQKSAKLKTDAIVSALGPDWGQSYEADIDLHNHPSMLGWKFHYPSGIDKAAYFKKNMLDVSFIVTRKGIVIHKEKTLMKIPWSDTQKVQIVCDLFNQKKTWVEVSKQFRLG